MEAKPVFSLISIFAPTFQWLKNIQMDFICYFCHFNFQLTATNITIKLKPPYIPNSKQWISDWDKLLHYLLNEQ